MKLLDVLTPINIPEERRKFFASQIYNPIFKYGWQNKKLQIHGDSIKAKLKRAIVNQSLPEILAYTQYYTGITEFVYANKANNFINQNINNTTSNFKTDEKLIYKAFNEAFKYFDLNYKIEFTDLSGFNFRPDYKNKILYASKEANLTFFHVDSEVKHELTHIIRHENSKYNGIEKSADYIQAEEGLATYFQDNSEFGQSAKYQHAGEYIASMIGLSGSLRDIYYYFIDIGFDAELAWQRSIRHKFGFVDTNLAGDILKPAMYFHNSLKISLLSSDDRLKLLIGRISFDDLAKYKSYQGRFDQNKLENFFKMSS